MGRSSKVDTWGLFSDRCDASVTIHIHSWGNKMETKKTAHARGRSAPTKSFAGAVQSFRASLLSDSSWWSPDVCWWSTAGCPK